MRGDWICQISVPTGHAIIQPDSRAQNAILLYGGANQELTEDYADEVLAQFGPEVIPY